jgi:hypothetical protein
MFLSSAGNLVPRLVVDRVGAFPESTSALSS